MKKKLLSIVALALLAGPMTASATLYNISFTETGIGDAGPDWFGTFDAPATGGVLTSANIMINGITYDEPADGLFATWSGTQLDLFLQASSDITQLLQFHTNLWAVGTCEPDAPFCGGYRIRGTYTVEEASVPEPGTLALFGLGLAALGFARRRRATH